MQFSELLDRYRESQLPDLAPSTRRAYECSITGFHTFFVEGAGDPGVGDIGRGAVASFLTWRRRHAPDGTVRELACTCNSLSQGGGSAIPGYAS